MSDYPNPTPDLYTVHVQIQARDDVEALRCANVLMNAIGTTHARIFVNLDEPPVVTDSDDWAEAAATKCQYAQLDLEPAQCDVLLQRTGNGRRLCGVHRAMSKATI